MINLRDRSWKEYVHIWVLHECLHGINGYRGSNFENQHILTVIREVPARKLESSSLELNPHSIYKWSSRLNSTTSDPEATTGTKQLRGYMR